MSQTEDYSPEASFLDYSEKLPRRSMVFSTVLYLVRTKNIKQGRDTFLQGFRNKTRPAQTQRVSMALAPGKGVLSSKEYQHGCPRKGGI